MEAFSLVRLLAIVIMIGVPAVLICKMLFGIRNAKRRCSCGGQVTPLAGHGPCGCCLNTQPIQARELEERRAKGYS